METLIQIWRPRSIQDFHWHGCEDVRNERLQRAAVRLVLHLSASEDLGLGNNLHLEDGEKHSEKGNLQRYYEWVGHVYCSWNGFWFHFQLAPGFGWWGFGRWGDGWWGVVSGQQTFWFLPERAFKTGRLGGFGAVLLTLFFLGFLFSRYRCVFASCVNSWCGVKEVVAPDPFREKWGPKKIIKKSCIGNMKLKT